MASNSYSKMHEATEYRKKDINDAFNPSGEVVNRNLITRMKIRLEYYFESVENSEVWGLKELIKFNEDHAESKLPAGADNQAGLIEVLNAKMSDDKYYAPLDFARDPCGRRGVDAVLEENAVDIILSPRGGPLLSISGTAGRPSGMQIIVNAYREALLIQAQSAWKATIPKRQPPPLDQIIR
ncbi:hypothetical protein F5144DRAFT_550710 [Chaetomium tenue]|uniref:Uncharacterized protein n=1 Tax=Chaetomium tenue TaxID=1854479 RepID=A0ACB7P1D9_9PEZI|nr:hypothetical protein F5144DRAFT_550710 [Chaetomium globosum]